MKLIIEMPEDIAPGMFNKFGAEDRAILMAAYAEARPVVEGNVVTYEPVEWAAPLTCKTVKLYAEAMEDK